MGRKVFLTIIKTGGELTLDEYQVVWRWGKGGKKDEGKTYYASDLNDARLSLVDFLRFAGGKGYDVEIGNNKYTRDLEL